MRSYYFLSFLLITTLFASLTSCNQPSSSSIDNKTNAILISDSITYQNPALAALLSKRNGKITTALEANQPLSLINSLSKEQTRAIEIALNSGDFSRNLTNKQGEALLNEIFNVYEARPQEVEKSSGKVFKVEMYNYAINLTTTAFVDLTADKILSTTTIEQSQPDIPDHLKELAIQLAINHPEIIKALGYKPSEKEALMSNTKTALNKTKCERSRHLCVAPTFTIKDKALWAIIDLTDLKLVGYRWTNTGTEQPALTVTEKRLEFDKIMECYCKTISKVEKYGWDLNYVITTSDGLRISEVIFKDKLVLNNAKVVDWHVNYSNTDGFGYSDAVGCPAYSQAAVVADTEPRISDIEENGKIIGFALEQNFSTELWPMPCNYNYLQRYEFYKNGSWRSAVASLGRGCGNNGTYRPVLRFSFPGDKSNFSEFNKNEWTNWDKEQWKLQEEETDFTEEGYKYKITHEQGGFYLEPNQGQFNDNSRGDHPYVYLTKKHPELDEGEKDLVSIGPCCNTDYQQGPEKFINDENTKESPLVLWYVCQMKNDDTKGKEYCWAERYIENGVYKTKVYPCLSGPKFVPLN